MTGQMWRHLQRREKKSGEKGGEWRGQWVTWFIEARTRTYSQEEKAGEMWSRDEGVSTWVKAEKLPRTLMNTTLEMWTQTTTRGTERGMEEWGWQTKLLLFGQSFLWTGESWRIILKLRTKLLPSLSVWTQRRETSTHTNLALLFCSLSSYDFTAVLAHIAL